MITKWINKIDLNFTIFGLCMIIVVTCTKIEREPKVETGTITYITTNSAKAEGNIIDIGNGITEHGHCWSATSNPTVNDLKTSLGVVSKTGSYTSILQSLQHAMKYYIKAYLVDHNSDTIYGRESWFRTKPETGYVKDIDGNGYITVRIGSQWWMAENLKTTKLNDGTDIPMVFDNKTWGSLTTIAYCWYKNDEENYKNEYGALYNWYAVNTGKICPVGWHMPSDNEWTTLTNYLGGENVAGGKLKEASTTHWDSPNIGATNESGFTALPGGSRLSNGEFRDIGQNGNWWSSTEQSSQFAWQRVMFRNLNGVGRVGCNMEYGFSVRCLKD